MAFKIVMDRYDSLALLLYVYFFLTKARKKIKNASKMKNNKKILLKQIYVSLLYLLKLQGARTYFSLHFTVP